MKKTPNNVLLVRTLGIIALAVIITFSMANCGGGGGGGGDDDDDDGGNTTKTYTVTFDAAGGSPAPATQTLSEGDTVSKPDDPVKSPQAGLYEGTAEDINDTFNGWYNGDTQWNFTTSTVTKDITLTAKWTSSGAERIESVAVNDIAAAVSYVNTNAEEYTLIIDEDVEAAPQVLNTANVKLTIEGMGIERKISLNADGILFTVGGTSGNTPSIALTLGNNITLVGRANTAAALVTPQSRATLTMLNGSKITGHTGSNAGSAGAAVYVNSNSFFTMKGGTITGNDSSLTANNTTGGVFVSTNALFTMEGGSISGNGDKIDVYLSRLAADGFILKGSAQIGTLGLDTDGTDYSSVRIGAGWTGSVGRLNLRGSANPASNQWIGKTVAAADTGHTLSAADIAKLTLGNFIPGGAISGNNNLSVPNYKIENSGADMGKLVADPYDTVTVTFNSNGGSAVSSITLFRGGTIGKPADPTKTGYDSMLEGWYREAALTNQWNFANPVTADITLYAKWKGYAIGDTGPGGGIVFYVSQSGFTHYTNTDNTSVTCYYLEAAPVDLNSLTAERRAWGNITIQVPNTTREIGTGLRNTLNIMSANSANPNLAANYCYNYINNGKNDWFLPSLYELQEIARNRTVLGWLGPCWSSTQDTSNPTTDAVAVTFMSGSVTDFTEDPNYKNQTWYIRPVRAF